MKLIFVTIMLSFAALFGCGQREEDIYTLYRQSPIDHTMRIHVATFNANAGEKYNQDNCDIASNLFANQPDVTVKYWCEKGPYRP